MIKCGTITILSKNLQYASSKKYSGVWNRKKIISEWSVQYNLKNKCFYYLNIAPDIIQKCYRSDGIIVICEEDESIISISDYRSVEQRNQIICSTITEDKNYIIKILPNE